MGVRPPPTQASTLTLRSARRRSTINRMTISVQLFTRKIDFLLTDIDDTLTDQGQIHADAYAALWKLHRAGIRVIPITGRPAGWCEMIARMWPVAGIVGENGGFWFRYHGGKMLRGYSLDVDTMTKNRAKLDALKEKILREVPGCDLASDQFCRMMDLAIDFCEDVPALPEASVKKIVSLFEAEGAQAKVSSIHVNGWFGAYDKKTTTLKFLKEQFGLDPSRAFEVCAFSGDSPNDEPMFATFPSSFGVANVANFLSQMKAHPAFITKHEGGAGFVEIAERLIAARG